MICSITHTIVCLRELPPAPRCMHATAVEARTLSLVPTLCTHLPSLRRIACPWRMRPCFSQAPCLQVKVCLYSAVKQMGRRGAGRPVVAWPETRAQTVLSVLSPANESETE